MMECIFVGNRKFVLEKLLKKKLPLKIIVIKDSHLEKEFISGYFGCIEYTVIGSKKSLIDLLMQSKYDLLISNGCPYILPVLKLPAAKYINIHPSFLPDLKGCDPVIGAVLYMRDAGATCHIMDSGVDTGPIVSQCKIPITSDLDVTTLYQLSFIAESNVFEKAFKLNFQPQYLQSENQYAIYFNRSKENMVINSYDSNLVIFQKIKAFNNKSIGCSFYCNGVEYKVFRATKMNNPFLLEHVFKYDECHIAMNYEDSIVFHKDGEVIRFEGVYQELQNPLLINQLLFGG